MTFKILPKQISGASVTIPAQTYTGKALTPEPTVKIGSTTLKKGIDYTLSYKNNSKVGTATVTVTGKGNYTGTKAATFRIAPISIASATVASIANQTYTGKAITPSPAVKVGTKALVKGTDYTLSYKNNTKVGTATVTVTGKGSYSGTKSVTFKIVAKASAKAKANVVGLEELQAQEVEIPLDVLQG